MKKRYLTHKIILREDTHIVWNETNQFFEFINNKGEITNKHLISTGESYERAGKSPKVIREYKWQSGTIGFNHMYVNHDRYLAIDTSYISLEENNLCVTSCLSIEQDIPNINYLLKDEKLKVLLWPRLVFLARKNFNPERYAWMRYIQSLLKSCNYREDYSYGVVVDSDLDDIPKINAGEISIFDNFYIPNNISLIYASADTGNENMQNKLIQQSDMVAKHTLKKVNFTNGKSLECVDLQSDFLDIGMENYHIKINL